MRYLQSFIVLLSFLLVAVPLVIPVSSDDPPPYPDDGNVDSFLEWMGQWKIDNMDPAAKKAEDSYDALEGLVGDYKSAINGVRAVAFSAVSGIVQDNWVGLVMSVYGTSKDAARAIAKMQTLQEAVEEGASDHSLYLYYYNDLYDKHGTVDQGIVFGKINNEIATLGGMLVQAETMMEAYYRYEVLIILYNRQVEAWNIYAPSRPVSTRWTTVPSKVLFKKFSCFGGCGYDHDTLDYARDTHQTPCGTAPNIDEVLQDAPILLTPVHSTALQRRTVVQGCGHPYYVCHPEQVLQHHAWTCHVIGCSVKYRNCLTHTKDHSNHGTSGAEAPSTPPTSGSLLMAACNVHPTSDSGDHTSTYLCNISPCSNRIVPSCLAICPETGNHGKVVCTISGCQDSTPYDATSSSAGLHAYHFECSQYKCNGVDHSWQTSCTDTAHTNTNGDSCTASGFYECVSHTPVYLSSDNGNNDNDDSSTQVRCGHCDEDYDPQWDGEEHTRIWTCSFCGQDYISCLDEVCTSSSYGYHYPR